MKNSEIKKYYSEQLFKKTEVEDAAHRHMSSIQSANVLFKFFDDITYLKDVIKHSAIFPRYCEEITDYMRIENIESISFLMSCFCDIPLSKLSTHMEFYGKYGIGLDKEWGIEKGIQPIQYINSNSELIKSFKDVLLKSFEKDEKERQAVSEYNNYILTNLLFMKPLEGIMFRNGENVKRNFHDEREWRYVPDVNNCDTELPLIIEKEYDIDQSRKMYSNGVMECEDLWLKFKYNNVKYLIVKNYKERNELIKFIKNNTAESENEKFILSSKILVFDELKEDM